MDRNEYEEIEQRREQRRRRRRQRQRRRRILIGALCTVCAVALGLALHGIAARDDPPPPEPPPETEPVDVPDEHEEVERPYALSETGETIHLADEVVSEFAVFADAESGQILAEKNSDAKMYPASMTKVLTLLVAAEQMGKPSGTFTMTREIADYCFVNRCSVVGYVVGEEIPVIELFYGCILCSGADASLGLAELCAGSHEAFVKKMNEKAAELGIADTSHFTNCVGVYDPEHYCTARDMAAILKAALENELCRTVLTTPVYFSQETEQHSPGQTLSNWFVRRMSIRDTGEARVLCGKTGYVAESGNCAASYGEDAAGRGYLCVTGKGGTQWQVIADHERLYQQYGQGT
ncbi:MAG: D-alanyl-D-alanine carboxypeptidase [Oscillospiraceae bacterium]|nr:D-alanyl-D-alanine carboxypeptidase [Oscillospiraceae bacterium]